MSSLAAWSYTAEFTIWKFVSEDEFNQPTYAKPYTITGDWEVGGGTETDESGEEFVAISKYYFEADECDECIPSRGDFIKRGNFVDDDNPTTVNAEKIKKVNSWNMAMFGADELPDWVIMT